jgi:transposase
VISLSRRLGVFAYTRPVDMRKHYDGLYALVVSELKADPLSGDLFLFTNRRRTNKKCANSRRASLRSSSKAVRWPVPYGSPRRRPPRKF